MLVWLFMCESVGVCVCVCVYVGSFVCEVCVCVSVCLYVVVSRCQRSILMIFFVNLERAFPCLENIPVIFFLPFCFFLYLSLFQKKKWTCAFLCNCNWHLVPLPVAYMHLLFKQIINHWKSIAQFLIAFRAQNWMFTSKSKIKTGPRYEYVPGEFSVVELAFTVLVNILFN